MSNTWITDKNGNQASVEHWGSEEKARASLETLKNCVNCWDCWDCRDCRDCWDCRDCVNCRDCSNCVNCWDCVDCRDCSNCVNCVNCRNCRDCSNCWDCVNCSNCVNCWNCRGCRDCVNCVNIKYATSPIVVGPFRSDGYQFVIGNSGSLHAGCRVFKDFVEAREHWNKTRGDTPLGKETMLILDFLENMVRLRPIS